ncbi:hypothetical protein SNEBB_003335, partial [Seison nebaliae]
IKDMITTNEEETAHPRRTDMTKDNQEADHEEDQYHVPVIKIGEEKMNKLTKK